MEGTYPVAFNPEETIYRKVCGQTAATLACSCRPSTATKSYDARLLRLRGVGGCGLIKDGSDAVVLSRQVSVLVQG